MNGILEVIKNNAGVIKKTVVTGAVVVGLAIVYGMTKKAYSLNDDDFVGELEELETVDQESI